MGEKDFNKAIISCISNVKISNNRETLKEYDLVMEPIISLLTTVNLSLWV